MDQQEAKQRKSDETLSTFKKSESILMKSWNRKQIRVAERLNHEKVEDKMSAISHTSTAGEEKESESVRKKMKMMTDMRER